MCLLYHAAIAWLPSVKRHRILSHAKAAETVYNIGIVADNLTEMGLRQIVYFFILNFVNSYMVFHAFFFLWFLIQLLN